MENVVQEKSGPKYFIYVPRLDEVEQKVIDFMSENFPSTTAEEFRSGNIDESIIFRGYRLNLERTRLFVNVTIDPRVDQDRYHSLRVAREIAEKISGSDLPELATINSVSLETVQVLNTGDVSVDGEPLIPGPLIVVDVVR